MLRRGDSKGQGDQPEGQGNSSPASETQANPTANIAPAGLSWQPMRHAWEERGPGRAGIDSGGESVIGPQDFFEGTYRSKRGIRVQGRVRGSIESQGHVLVEERAQVDANITAEDITIAGRYDGKVECRRRFEIASTGVVTGEINTDRLVVQEGGYFDGNLKMKQRPGQQAGQAAGGGTARPGNGEPQGPAQV